MKGRTNEDKYPAAERRRAMRHALLAGLALCLLLTTAPAASAGTADGGVDVIVGQCPVCYVCPTTVNDWAFRPVDSAMACLSGDP